MNKTTIFVTVATLVGVIIVGVIAATLMGINPDRIVTLLTIAIPTVTGLALTLAGIKSVDDKVKEVAKLTNGNTERLLNHLEAGTAPNEDTVQSVRTQSAKVGDIANGGSGHRG